MGNNVPDNADEEIRDFIASTRGTDYGFVACVREHQFVFCLRGSVIETRKALARCIVDLRNNPEFELSDIESTLMWALAGKTLNLMEANERERAF